MKKRILNYMTNIDVFINKYEKIVDKDCDNSQSLSTKNELDNIINEHLVQISFFQHERLIHLLVTILFSILSVASIFYTISTNNIAIFILTILLLILLIPYIKHYYLLENGVQKMYDQYDKLLELKNKN